MKLKMRFKLQKFILALAGFLFATLVLKPSDGQADLVKRINKIQDANRNVTAPTVDDGSKKNPLEKVLLAWGNYWTNTWVNWGNWGAWSNTWLNSWTNR